MNEAVKNSTAADWSFVEHCGWAHGNVSQSIAATMKMSQLEHENETLEEYVGQFAAGAENKLGHWCRWIVRVAIGEQLW